MVSEDVGWCELVQQSMSFNISHCITYVCVICLLAMMDGYKQIDIVIDL